jgi:hypothetical protein
MTVSWHRAEDLTRAVQAKLVDVDVLLDVGCGINPQTLVVPRVHICCEPFPEYVAHLQDAARAGRARVDVVLRLSWADALKALPDKSVDSVCLIDVIEHLEKAEGVALLRDTERVARRQIVLFTPLGFMPQHITGSDAWGLGGSEVQEHRSGWGPEDFDDGWDLVAAREYHRSDAFGKPLPEPFGAFFAVRNLAPLSAEPQRDRALRRLSAEGASITNPAVLAKTLDLLGSARRVNVPWMLAPAQVVLDVLLALRDSWAGRLAYKALHRMRGEAG